jgi:hypothetical protein
MSHGRIMRGVAVLVSHGGGWRRGPTPVLPQVRQEGDDLTQPLKCQQMRRVPGERCCACIVGRGHGKCGVGPIGEPHDEVGINALADAHAGDARATPGVMGMGNGHRSRRRLE